MLLGARPAAISCTNGRPPKMATITDTIKNIVDELEIERRITEIAEQAEKALLVALTKAGDYVHEHSSDIEGMLDKASTAIDERTDGKFADTLDKVKDQVNLGVTKLAEKRGTGADAGSSDN
jgi:HEPN domain-containing protein